MLGVFGVPCVDVGLVAGSQGALSLLLDLLTGESPAGRGDRLVRGAGRSLGRTSQVAKRWMSWPWSGSVIVLRWAMSQRSNEQICLSMRGRTPQAMSSSRRCAAARQGCRV
ncbi:MAG: hypothetical protein ACRDR6_26665 [Pseudonocardiaceae bacterium]